MFFFRALADKSPQNCFSRGLVENRRVNPLRGPIAVRYCENHDMPNPQPWCAIPIYIIGP